MVQTNLGKNENVTEILLQLEIKCKSKKSLDSALQTSIKARLADVMVCNSGGLKQQKDKGRGMLYGT